MKVILAGGSGQIGTVLARAFHGRGDEAVVLSRTPARGVPWRTAGWDGNEIDGADVVINLAGRSVDCRYHPANRKEILSSRVDTTLALGRAIAAATRPPKLWLQSSTATIYAHRYDAPNDEFTGRLGGGERGAPGAGQAPDAKDTWEFSISVAKAWEAAFDSCAVPAGCRKVAMRSAMVMSPDHGGVFDVLLRLVRFGLGGRAGDGRQYVSWIHDGDFVRAILWLIEHEEMEGAVNLASPGPVPNTEFMRLLRRAWGMPVGLPAAEWMVELGAFFLRTESELILKSRRVVPGRLLQAGFQFEHPEWGAAAVDLCSRWRMVA
jgi:uncharacterized protein